jgi:hypothetical protein
MGENADDLVEGRTCSLCGMFFLDKNGDVYTHGYPVVCWECWSDLTKQERKQYQRSEVETL